MHVIVMCWPWRDLNHRLDCLEGIWSDVIWLCCCVLCRRFDVCRLIYSFPTCTISRFQKCIPHVCRSAWFVLCSIYSVRLSICKKLSVKWCMWVFVKGKNICVYTCFSLSWFVNVELQWNNYSKLQEYGMNV